MGSPRAAKVSIVRLKDKEIVGGGWGCLVKRFILFGSILIG